MVIHTEYINRSTKYLLNIHIHLFVTYGHNTNLRVTICQLPWIAHW